jgi:hypothetical protein
MTEPDPFLRRFERDALVACGLMALLAMAVSRGDWEAGASVLAGGALSAVSYRAIRGAVTAVGTGAPAGALVKFFTRYGMLALAAYVMLARFGLHPLGVVAGASSLVVAAMVAAARALRPMARSRRHRGTNML